MITRNPTRLKTTGVKPPPRDRLILRKECQTINQFSRLFSKDLFFLEITLLSWGK